MASLDKPDITICEWQASLYEEKKRKWVYGSLKILANEITFIAKDDGKTMSLIPFENFADVKKATTGLVFGAVYIVKKNGDKVWLSSLADREGVYSALKHFWRAQLIGSDSNTKNKSSMSGTTAKGQKLLSIVKDSEETLSKAATQLHSQGAQIGFTLATMSDLHTDLDIAENFVEDLESWLVRFKTPKRYTSVDPVFVNKSEIPEVFEYEVLYTRLETGKANNKCVGTLRVSKDGITILNMKQRTEHHYSWGNVSNVRVITPFEVFVVQCRIGTADLVYSVICAQMVAILKLLDKCAHHKLKYDKPPGIPLCATREGTRRVMESSSLSSHQQQCTNSSEIRGAPARGHLRNVDQVHVNQTSQVVSESEADEISRALTGLRSLALSVAEEQSIQNEELDTLTTSVDKANQRLAQSEKRIKRLM